MSPQKTTSDIVSFLNCLKLHKMNIKFELKCNFVVFKLDISNLFEFLIHFMPKKLRKEEIDI